MKLRLRRSGWSARVPKSRILLDFSRSSNQMQHSYLQCTYQEGHSIFVKLVYTSTSLTLTTVHGLERHLPQQDTWTETPASLFNGESLWRGTSNAARRDLIEPCIMITRVTLADQVACRQRDAASVHDLQSSSLNVAFIVERRHMGDN